jgi:DNA processing protein
LSPEVRDLLTLHLVPGLGPRLTAALLERFGSARAVLEADADQLSEVPHIGPRLAQSFYRAMREADVGAELERMAQHRTELLAFPAPPYPAALATIADPPLLLYLRGTIEARDAQAVAVVGSRKCTGYGIRMAERLAAGLARAGCTVVSGLARGIDAAAHRGALQAGGRTLAVLAGGLSRIYPPEHADFAREVESSGALLSESAMRMESMPGLFPPRNRIISGLARAVVIVEAAEKSGALITADLAAEQGRPVLAVPGPVESAASAGTNALIRDGAILCRGVEDILEELHDLPMPTLPEQEAPPPAAEAVPPPELDETQRRIWDALADGPRHTDELARELTVPVSQLMGLLLTLEMKKAVRRLPGNRYERWR